MTSNDWSYTTGVRIFRDKSFEAFALLDLLVNEIPTGEPVPGYLCRAGRELLRMTQAELASAAGVAKKSVNDFELEFTALRPDLVTLIRKALQDRGARFVAVPGVSGVVVETSRQDFEGRSRSPHRQAGQIKVRADKIGIER
jgi:DNA-binding XRE family transcriptional regulator